MRPSGISRRWKATARRVSPNAWTGFVSPSIRAPAGIEHLSARCASRAAFVTRQFTGAAHAPSRRWSAPCR